VLYPSEVWEWASRAGGRFRHWFGPLSVVSERAAGLASGLAVRWVALTAPLRRGGARVRSTPPLVRDTTRWLALTALPALLLVVSLLSAAGSAGVVDTPASADRAAETADLGQEWRMFAPDPPDRTWWVATPATRPDGRSVDAFHDEALARDSPEQADRMASFRWRKYFKKIRHEEESTHHAEYARYLCANRNIDSVAIHYGYRTTEPGRTEFGGETLASFECAQFVD
jgi:hypothetical protein